MAFFHYPNGKLTQTAKKMVSAERRKESQKQNYSCASFPLLYQPEISHKRTKNKKKKTIHKIESRENSYRGAVKANEPLRHTSLSIYASTSKLLQLGLTFIVSFCVIN